MENFGKVEKFIECWAPLTLTARSVYRIAGNFRAVQNFAFFADRSCSTKIKTTKKFCNAHAQRQGLLYLCTVGTGSKMTLYRYFSSATETPRDRYQRKCTRTLHTCARYVRLGYENGRGSIKHKRENKNHENFF